MYTSATHLFIAPAPVRFRRLSFIFIQRVFLG
jgi:hypothetical protein